MMEAVACTNTHAQSDNRLAGISRYMSGYVPLGGGCVPIADKAIFGICNFKYSMVHIYGCMISIAH